MKRKALAITAALTFAAIVIIGCGGGGGGGSSTTTTGGTTATTGSTTSSTTGSTSGANASPFAGRWDGTLTQASTSDTGTITLAIAGNGDIAGDVFDKNHNAEGILSGFVTSNGSFSVHVQYPGNITDNWSGHVAVDSQHRLIGDVTVNNSTAQTFTLTTQSS